MATHSSILACKNPWTEESVRLQSMGSQSWTQLSDFISSHFFHYSKETFLFTCTVSLKKKGFKKEENLQVKQHALSKIQQRTLLCEIEDYPYRYMYKCQTQVSHFCHLSGTSGHSLSTYYVPGTALGIRASSQQSKQKFLPQGACITAGKGRKFKSTQT